MTQHLGIDSGESSKRGETLVLRRSLQILQVLFAVGLITGLPGLYPDSEKTSPQYVRAATSFVAPVARAVDTSSTYAADAQQEAALLTAWPDLFKDSEEIQSAANRKTSKTATAKKERGPLKTAAKKPDTERGRSLSPANLDSDKGGPLTPKKDAKAEILARAKKIAEMNSNPSASPAKKVAPKKVASGKSKKGYTIKAVNGKLVVVDSKGEVVIRSGDSAKRAKKESAKTAAAPPVKTEVSSEKETAPRKSLAKVIEASKEAAKKKSSTAAANAKPRFVEIEKGENLSLIASRYPGVTADDLMEANQIDDPRSIQIGSKIWVPDNKIEGISHTVKPGETLSELVKKYEIESLFEVCDLNGLRRTQNILEPGTTLVLPGAKARPRWKSSKTPSRMVKRDLSDLKGRVTWMWPLEDGYKVSSPYGLRVNPFSKKGSGIGGRKIKRTMHHGVDLAIPNGTPVFAARDGVVVEAGRKRLHGHSVKVRHADNWCTVYSHNTRLLVKKGDRVEQGQQIAISGNTGRSTGPHLHFEIRQPNQKSYDPRLLLPK